MRELIKVISMKNKVILFLTTFLLLTGCNTGKKSSNPATTSSSSETSQQSSDSSEPLIVSLSSISVSGQKTEYEVGDSFVKPTVTAHYSDQSNKDVSASATFTGFDSSIAVASQTITVSYTEEEITKTTTYNVVIKDNTPVEAYDYNGYYAGLSWTNSEDLINKLHAIISTGYTSKKYEGNWSTNQNADQALDDFEMVDLIYSDEKDLKTNTYANGKGWQREHAFAASLMTGFTSGDAVGVHQGRATDFHNLFASAYSGNTSRGNKNFGIANPEDPTYLNPGPYSSDSKNFEPSNTDKGRLSRAIFYMAVMYNSTESETVKVTLNYNDEDKATYGKASTTVPIPVTYQPLQVVEEYVSYDKFTYTNWYYHNTKPDTWEDEKYQSLQDAVTLYGEGADGYAAYSMANCQYAIGNLSTLLSWADTYTVDMLEMQHNIYVYSGEDGQGNRNPFVDYPELVSYCFGDKKNQSGSLDNLMPSYYSLHMNEDAIHHYAIETAKRSYDEGATFNVGDYTTKAVKNDLSVVATDYQDTTPSYTFTPSDVAAGTKVLTINTPKNDISLKVTINAGSIDSCSYKGGFINKAKGDFSKGGNVTVDGVEWNTSWTNSSGAMGNKDSTYGIAFGVASGGKTMHELTIQTTSSYSVNKVFFKGSCKAGETIDVTIKVGEQTVYSGSITRTSGVTTAPEVVGNSFSSLTGKVTIIVNGTGATNGAVYVHTIAFNTVS